MKEPHFIHDEIYSIRSQTTLTDWALGFLSVLAIALLVYAVLVVFS